MPFQPKLNRDQLAMAFRHVRRLKRAEKEPKASNMIRYVRLMFHVEISDETARRYIITAQDPDPEISLKPSTQGLLPRMPPMSERDIDKLDEDLERDAREWDALPHDHLDAYLARVQAEEAARKKVDS